METLIVMWYARIALAASAIFGLSIVALHFLEPEFDPASRAISQYVHGPYGALMTVAFVAGGVASLALAVALARQRVSRAGQFFLTLAGVGSVLSAAFPVDADGAQDTLTGSIHENVGLCTFISLLVAAVVLTRAFGTKHEWRSFQRTSLGLTLVMACGFVCAFGSNAFDDVGGLFGMVQRLFIGSAIVWQCLVAIHAARGLRVDSAEPTRASAAVSLTVGPHVHSG